MRINNVYSIFQYHFPLNLDKALPPSKIACEAKSDGNNSLTAVYTSYDDNVFFF